MNASLSPDPSLSPEDLIALRNAIKKLECLSFLMKAANAIGSPIEAVIESLPTKAHELVQEATMRSLNLCLDMALYSLDTGKDGEPSNVTHKAAAAVSGFLGGFWGYYALPVELPVSTAIMLRSIADIARSEGENLADREVQLSCLSVFALGGPSKKDDNIDIGYFATRATLGGLIRDAAAFVADKGGGEAIARLLTAIAERFSATVAEKAAVQAVPILSGIAGSTINLVFIDYFQDVASGHFAIRRLERKYGPDLIRAEYEREWKGLEC